MAFLSQNALNQLLTSFLTGPKPPLLTQFQAVEDGRLQVDGRKVPPSYCLRQGQTVVHFVHRHEPPVMDQPVKVLFSDADVVVVQKPASVPVHPCGQYRKNTVLGILQAEHPELGTLSRILSGRCLVL